MKKGSIISAEECIAKLKQHPSGSECTCKLLANFRTSAGLADAFDVCLSEFDLLIAIEA